MSLLKLSQALKTVVILILLWIGLHQPLAWLFVLLLVMTSEQKARDDHNNKSRKSSNISSPDLTRFKTELHAPQDPRSWTVARKQAYLQTPEWRELGKLIRSNYNHTCQGCGIESGLMHVHHLTYERLGEEWLEDLTLLCPRCHQAQHDHYGYDYRTVYSPIIKRK